MVVACSAAGLLPGWARAQASAAASAGTLPFKQDGAGVDFPAGGGVLLSLLLFALLLCCLYAAWRGKGGVAKKTPWLSWLPVPPASAELRVAASARLAGRTSVHVIEWEGGKLLVSCGEQGVVRLAAMPPGAGAATSAQAPAAGDLS
ncbi:flagellar biosynthetic protein FliO [Collimonas humicola]|uniref:flagellar biosynthetic protein FliO n=1 Tax=Collimonas humicola TaxID=2825886 RepID=UPI001B8CFE60|nr:flagellar biosynthetic protein FliO [Collimonas humicola]